MRFKRRPVHQQILDFLDARYAEELQMVQQMKVGLRQVQLDAGATPEAIDRLNRIGVEKAELLQRFLDETVRPHLGADGLTGQVADQQLRLLAWAYSDRPGYEDEWEPAKAPGE